MPSAEAWRYIGLELPIRKVGSLCKVSELLTLLELKFLGDRVWLPCSSCQGFAFLLQANIVVLACSNNKGFLKVSTAGKLQPHITDGECDDGDYRDDTRDDDGDEDEECELFPDDDGAIFVSESAEVFFYGKNCINFSTWLLLIQITYPFLLKIYVNTKYFVKANFRRKLAASNT